MKITGSIEYSIDFLNASDWDGLKQTKLTRRVTGNLCVANEDEQLFELCGLH